MHNTLASVPQSLHSHDTGDTSPSVSDSVSTLLGPTSETDPRLLRILWGQLIDPTVEEICECLHAADTHMALKALRAHQEVLDAREREVTQALLEACRDKRIGREFFSERMRTLQIPAQRLREWWEILKTAMRIDYITRTNAGVECPPDIKALDLKALAEKYLSQKSSEASSGSNQRGVFRIEWTDTLLVLRSPGTYEYQWALVGLTQALDYTVNAPRTLRYEVDEQYAYQVIERADGIGCGSFAPSALNSVQHRHIRAFVATVQHLNDRGLMIDPSKTSNIFYSAKKGFACIDLGYWDITQASVEAPPQWQNPTLLYIALVGTSDTTVAPRLFCELSEASDELFLEK